MNKVFFGDCRDSLRQMAADGVKVQMCVTSPPYFGLRDYGHDGQLGMEETPDQFIAELVEVFRCVRDVLSDDGTLWLNIGDSYARTGGSDRKPSSTSSVGNTVRSMEAMPDRRQRAPYGLKEKDLIGIPWLLAFALRADGWHLRQDIIWHKPNSMPESVTDRCTKAHEYMFLLSKAPRYFYNHEAIKEVANCGARGSEFHTGKTGEHQLGRAQKVRPSKVRGDFVGKNILPGKEAFRAVVEMRNRRSVWSIATKPYKGAHFAVFPEKLAEPCILAGSRIGDIVLDPFFGSGTTAAVAIQHGRQYIGCELNADYKPLQDERIAHAIALVNAPLSVKVKRIKKFAHPEADSRQMDIFGEKA
jgi:DNA modification methylase